MRVTESARHAVERQFAAYLERRYPGTQWHVVRAGDDGRNDRGERVAARVRLVGTAEDAARLRARDAWEEGIYAHVRAGRITITEARQLIKLGSPG
jgi:hypothetical protein